MPITAKAKPKELIPAGNYVARCYSMINVGTEPDNFGGTQNIVRLSWELPNHTKVFNEEKGPQPVAIHKEYSLTMGKKANLRKMLEAWRGKPFNEEQAKNFDVTKLLGVPCFVNIIEKESKSGNPYNDITSVTPLPKEVTCPPQVNESFIFSYEPYDGEQFSKIPEWLRNRIKETPEYKAATGVNLPKEVPAPIGGTDDDLPF